jgi:hypothetical protein
MIGATMAPQKDLASRMLRAARKAERLAGDGSVISGTGFTILRYQEPTIARLISSGKIGSEELRAIDEIEKVYSYLCSRLFLRGATVGEKLDRSHGTDAPGWFVEAYHERYKPWADEWSRLRKRENDCTLEIVFDILFSPGRTGKDIDREKGWQNGLAIRAFVAGIRHYAGSAGWVSGDAGRKWASVAGEVFRMHRMPRDIP